MSGTLSSISIDDGDRNITYIPAGQWTVHTNVNLSFSLFNNTDTFSSVQGATATVIFYGDAIEYWGNQGPFHGPCAISVDGQVMTTVNSNAPADDVPILLYSNTNLTLGDHSLEVRVVDGSFPNVCEVDRFVPLRLLRLMSDVFPMPMYMCAVLRTNITSSNNPPGGQSSTSSQSTVASTIGFVAQSTSFGSEITTSSSTNIAQTTSGLSGGNTSNTGVHTTTKSTTVPLAAIIGAAIGGAIVCIILLIFSLFRRSRKKRAQKRDITISKPFIVDNEPSSPAPQTPSFYQTSEENRTSYTASPIDQPTFTYYQPDRLPAKLVTRPRPAAFHPSLPYPPTPSDFDCPSPISEEPQSDICTISPTSVEKFEESQRNSPKHNIQRVLAVNNRGESSMIGSERYSDKSAATRSDVYVPPPAYDG